MADAPKDEGELSARVGEAGFVQRLFDELPLMIFALEGPDLRVGAVTAALRAFTGREHMIGVPVGEAFTEIAGQQLLEIPTRTYATGQPASLRDFRVQFDRPDNGERTEFFSDFTVHPRLGPDSEVTGVIVNIADVTERVRERQAAQWRADEAQRRYERARDVIDALQRELLPAGVPVLPRVQIAASYLLADVDTAAGGDWFDALSLPDGRVALIVGDVVGHGVAASATMGQLRIVLHERLAATADVLAAIRAADAIAARIRGARAATVCVAALDTSAGVLEYCTAGHPPPLLLTPGGEARHLPGTGAGPLGVGGDFTDASLRLSRLDTGDLVLLYTDGILERPGRELAESTVELAQVAGDVAADRALHDAPTLPAERVCTQTLELLTRVTGHTDDITLLCGQFVAPLPDLLLRETPGIERLTGVRERLDEWLRRAGTGEKDVQRLRHALGELVTNAMEHAYRDRTGEAQVTISATISDSGELLARVLDQGRWREPQPTPNRGRGLLIATGLVDSVQIEHDEYGTTATVRHRLSRAARLLTTDDLTFGATLTRPAQPDPFLVLDQPSALRPRVRVDGPVDAVTATEFDSAVRQAGAAGTRSLTVDLTGVTQLASAGVAVLHRLAALHRDNGSALRLYAPTAAPADVVMTLVQLQHATDDPDADDEGGGTSAG
jgi:serine phosphatase RsbU (regulator of sigma subunit)/anti-sigma regulatory factor (Ser/Thr protein kinase)/anti-anti-sigma regulatory factor